MDFRQASNYDNIMKEIEKLNTKTTSNRKDDRFWQPSVDKSGNGYAEIRFLPAPFVDGDSRVPWILLVSHGFQGPTGAWYIENSLTTIGMKDPVAILNNKLWNSGIESDKQVARNQRMQKQYVSNIYVVNDPANPENNGKIFLFRYGKKLFEKIKTAMKPEFEDETAINPFDMENGANFKIKIRHVEGYRNYDKSEFAAPSPLSKNVNELEKIWKSEYSLLDFLDIKNFKSFDELEKRLKLVLEGDHGSSVEARTQSHINEEIDLDDEIPDFDAKKTQQSSTDAEDDDAVLEYFSRLAKD